MCVYVSESVSVCVCVCACVRERDGQADGGREEGNMFFFKWTQQWSGYSCRTVFAAGRGAGVHGKNACHRRSANQKACRGQSPEEEKGKSPLRYFAPCLCVVGAVN